MIQGAYRLILMVIYGLKFYDLNILTFEGMSIENRYMLLYNYRTDKSIKLELSEQTLLDITISKIFKNLNNIKNKHSKRTAKDNTKGQAIFCFLMEQLL